MAEPATPGKRWVLLLVRLARRAARRLLRLQRPRHHRRRKRAQVMALRQPERRRLPLVASFDTAFHHDHAEVVTRFPLAR